MTSFCSGKSGKMVLSQIILIQLSNIHQNKYVSPPKLGFSKIFGKNVPFELGGKMPKPRIL